MTLFFESDPYAVPAQLKNDVAGRLKDVKGIRRMELEMKGDSLESAQEFGRQLLELRRRGVKISHEVKIRLEFPQAIVREKALALLASLPVPRNGSVRTRIEAQVDQPAPGAAPAA